tara:strand:- start:176 stop:868 length:693 start_codon:yes stop_codon:yes gene_type:complete
MNEEENLATGAPTADTNDFAQAESQEEVKTFTQDELDRIVKDRLDRERKRFEKKFDGVDVERYQQLTTAEENARLEDQKKRGEFEQILKSTVEKKDSTIQTLQQELQSIKVDGSLLNSASARKAINPKQVVSLVKDRVRLGETGEVEVLDDTGSIRYTDNGTAMSVDELVADFLNSNQHFVQAGPSGSGTQSVVRSDKNMGKVNASNLNMNDPADREIYSKMMKSKGIRI